MLLKKRYIKQLSKRLRKINDFVPELNWGGCGVFALALSDALSSYGIDHDIVVDINSRHLAHCWNTELTPTEKHFDRLYEYDWGHVLIVFNNEYFMDSDNIYRRNAVLRLRDHIIWITKDLLVEMVSDVMHWNYHYKRENNRFVKDFVELQLKNLTEIWNIQKSATSTIERELYTSPLSTAK